MKNTTRFLSSFTVFLLSWFLIATTGVCQTYNFTSYSIDAGLPQSQVTSLCQDKYGYLWMGTLGGGVCKFNGKNFKVFSTKNGLKSNSIRDIYEDKSGNIWVGTEGGGLSMFSEDTIITYTIENGLSHNTVFSITEDYNGAIWVTTYGGGITKIQFTKEKAQPTFTYFKEEDGLLDNRVNIVHQAKDGTIWIGTRRGLNIYDPSAEQTGGTTFKSYTREDGLTFNSILFIHEEDDGSIYLGTSGGGVNIFKDGKFTAITEEDGLSGNFIFSILKDRRDRFWFGTYGGGISMLDDGKITHITSKNGLCNDFVNSIIQDREGNIWIGTNNGVSKFSGNRFLTYSSNDNLASNNIFSITEDDNKNIWVGTKGGGISKFDGDQFITYTSKNGLCHDMVYSILKDKNNNMWVGSFGGGVCYFSDTDEIRFNQLLVPNEAKTQNHKFVLCMYEDSNGNLWYGTNNGGIVKYNLSKSGKDAFSFYTTDDGLNSNIVISMHEDKKGNIWIGTYSGISKYIPSENKFINYTTDDGLTHNIIISIIEDKNENLWFGTYGGGICKLDVESIESDQLNWTNYSHKDGLSSDNIILMVFDELGNLWVGTNQGIERLSFDGNKLRAVKHYGKSDGFSGIETNQNAVYRDSEDNLWFGTVDGLIKYNPAEDIPNINEPITRITNLRIFLKDAKMPTGLVLPYDQNHLTFDYIGLCLTAPENVLYQYRMEGFDKEWMPFTKENYVTYTNLPSGEYTFNVKACNNDGVWNTHATQYSFNITPPFWQTWWFYALCLTTLVISISTFIKVRTKKLEEAKKILEEKVAERTKEVVAQKEEIEKKNTSLEDANQEIAKQKDIVDLKNKDITDSIKYAEQIQEAILPNRDLLHNPSFSSFIYYKPKDIVSGDFYWFSQKNNILVVAAVDCTGHGVPGAFMSVVGNTLLNQIVNENKITKPSEILDNLHFGVRTALRQDEEGSGSRDGMDIALCTITFENNLDQVKNKVVSLQYAGANRPLFHVSGDELNIIKGTKFAIGGLQMDEKHDYVNNDVQVKSGDSIFLTSDGYIDQFGGPYGKKFMTRRFKDFLFDNREIPLDKQFSIFDKNFSEWKGDIEQLDDVLIIGMKF
ncbi:MAG: SpoIIE family protein phosphatase [Bacteroidia bacterium]|nr:SpoIIE family protein phosphatase [Bacteroidia bacterium]